MLNKHKKNKQNSNLFVNFSKNLSWHKQKIFLEFTKSIQEMKKKDKNHAFYATSLTTRLRTFIAL